MKKSNALMLSYMIFLVIAILAQIFFKWEGLDKIAISATVAGCFFAFADLAGWYISYRISCEEGLRRANDSLIDIYNITLDTTKNMKQEYLDSKKMLMPYAKRDEEIAVLTGMMDTAIAEFEKENEKVQESIKECYDVNSEIDKHEKRNTSIKIVEIILVICGFVAFFMLISFQYLVDFLYNYQSFATVIAFLVIMLTYFLRDVIEEKNRQEFDDMIKKAEEKKEEVKERNDKSKQKALIEKAKLLVESIEKGEQLKTKLKELKNGQTENAQSK